MDSKVNKKRWWEKIPHTYVILFLMIVIAAVLTWVLPAGQFERVDVEGLSRPVVVPGSYHTVEQSGVGIWGVFKSIPEGMVGASSIIFLIMISTAAFGIITETGALENGMGVLLNKVETSKIPKTAVIWVITFLFSAIGIIVGPEIQIPFTLIGVSIALGLGFDLIVGLGMIMGGGYAGWNFSPINASIVGTAHEITGLPIFSGMGFRFLTAFLATALVATVVSIYAKRIEANPDKSLVKDVSTEGLGLSKELHEYKIEGKHISVLVILLGIFVAIIYGSSKLGWYLDEMSTVFLIGGLLAGFVYGFTTDEIIDLFIKGVSSAASVALILGIARGIQITLEQGMIMDTIINALSAPLANFGPTFGAIMMSIVTAIVHFFIPSGSGLAVSLMPVLSPLGTIVGVTQQTTVLAFQFGATIPNYIFPTVGATMAMLGIARVPIDKWMKFALKLTALMFVLSWILLAVAVIIGY
ncbi:YfcC family protein [Erysipelothrix urinaevulpis]|uniref:YfcC family protein n=1 Tax=Erysipelothrix urinaevulpis TaxID=2683717 RepID=UPI001356916E|nr:TIGR00366 family protein [Erysipelothrix urinaevulpis]